MTNVQRQSRINGRIVRCRLPGDPESQYYKWLPSDVCTAAPPLVIVHGVSRRARAHLAAYRDWAEQTGTTLLAPVFDERRFQGYQRLGSSTPERSAADVVTELLDTEAHATDGRAQLFGFSGGAQFVHRYAMVRPERLVAAAIVAAGWYTMPTNALGYPYGVAPGRQPAGYRIDIDTFLSVPLAVFVGAYDVEQDDNLRSNRRIDPWQGNNRLARAIAWVAALEREAQQRGIESQVSFRVLPGVGHDFRDCYEQASLARHVTDFFARQTARAYSVAAELAGAAPQRATRPVL
ncbi:MAG: alpha/beta hydrolase [Pseudomonadota bacterium]